jgi:hypothetical protein
MKFPNIAQSILYAYTNVLSLCKSPVLTNTKFSIIRQLFKLVVLNLHNFGILKANEIKYLNVIIFTQKKSSKILDEVEYCTTICLVALAISDMMFCFTTFPIAFLPAKWVLPIPSSQSSDSCLNLLF